MGLEVWPYHRQRRLRRARIRRTGGHTKHQHGIAKWELRRGIIRDELGEITIDVICRGCPTQEGLNLQFPAACYGVTA